MKRIKQFGLPGMIILLVFVFGSTVSATNGYFMHGIGTHNKAMAGAGTALALSPLAAATNPAGMVYVGQRYYVGISLFNPNREYTVNGNPSGMGLGLAPGTVESESKTFFIPAAAGNWMLDDMSSAGVTVFGKGGMNTDYPTNTFGGSTPTGVNLSQLFVGATYSRKLVENHALGISGIFAYQMFSAEGLEAFANFSSAGDKLSNNGTDTGTGFGARIGYLGELADGFFVGASYQTKIAMSEFDDYAGLFAEQGDFDIPASWNAGVAVEASDDWTFAADVQQIMYSGIKAVSNSLDPATLNPVNNPQGFIPLGNDDAAGFGWDDMTVYKIGVQFTGVPEWTFRAGFSTGSQPIPESEALFNILAPGVIEQHVTFGVSKMLGDNELSLSVMHALSNTVSGPNTLEVPDAQSFDLTMDQWEFEVGFGF